MPVRCFSYADAKKFKGPSYKSFTKQKSAMGHSEGAARDERAQYEAEMKKR